MININLHNITKTQFYEFLVVESCISLYMHFLQSLLKFKIFRIEGRKYLLFIYLVENAAFIPIYHVKAVQDDISIWTIAQWLRNAVCVCSADGCLQLLVLQPGVNKLEEEDAPSFNVNKSVCQSLSLWLTDWWSDWKTFKLGESSPFSWYTPNCSTNSCRYPSAEHAVCLWFNVVLYELMLESRRLVKFNVCSLFGSWVAGSAKRLLFHDNIKPKLFFFKGHIFQLMGVCSYWFCSLE